MLSRATERRPSVPRPNAQADPRPQPHSETKPKQAVENIDQSITGAAWGVTVMLGHSEPSPLTPARRGLGANSPDVDARARTKSADIDDSAHRMAAPLSKKPTGWAPVDCSPKQEVEIDFQLPFEREAKSDPTSPNLNSLHLMPTGTTSAFASALAILAEQLREERARNAHLLLAVDQARAAAHEAELTLARREAKLEHKVEAIEKLEKRLAAA